MTSPETAKVMDWKGHQRVQDVFPIERHIEQMEPIYWETTAYETAGKFGFAQRWGV